MQAAHIAEQPSPRPVHDHLEQLRHWRAVILDELGRDATRLGGDPELYQARADTLSMLDNRISALTDDDDCCASCGKAELCDCAVSLT